MKKTRVMLFGNVDFGKTTLAYALTNQWLMKSSVEKKRNITIELNVSNFIIYRKGEHYSLSSIEDSESIEFQLIDNPGHRNFLTTTVSGIFFTELLVILFTPYQKPTKMQLFEILSICKLQGIEPIFVQNKAELILDEIKNESIVREFIDEVLLYYPQEFEVTPLSAKEGFNMDQLLRLLWAKARKVKSFVSEIPVFESLKSFDINRPGLVGDTDLIKGAIIGGLNLSSKESCLSGKKYLISQRGIVDEIQILEAFVDDVRVDKILSENFHTIEINSLPFLASQKGLVGSYLSEKPLESTDRLSMRASFFFREPVISDKGIIVFGSRIIIATDVLFKEDGLIEVTLQKKAFVKGVYSQVFFFQIINFIWELSAYCDVL